MNRYHTLRKDIDLLRQRKKIFLEDKYNLSEIKSQFSFTQKQFIAELAYIYPINVRILSVTLLYFVSIYNILIINNLSSRILMTNILYVIFIFLILKNSMVSTNYP